ncbi:UAP56-interacting factor-like [Varanus komodoensis]|uniref:Forty-two-three domain-containing protein 1 n=1 Tax=Varanus komodoensis TaxID=61221 RepID=A0A8D2L1C2_VARKO|nr:UAP56-interacting factor-like [Varanus komodoensis]
MESPGAGEQQVDAGAVGAAGPGRAGAAAEEEIDLSLDDIIKRNKKGRTNPRRASWRQQFKYRNPAYSSGKPRFRSWVPRNLQGPTRFRGGSRGQQFSRKPFWNGPRRGAAARAHGVSPLNRPGAAQQGKREGGAPVRSPGKGPAGEAQWQLPTRVQRFLPAGAPPPARRPFRLNRRPLFLQRQPRFSSSGQRIETNAQRKPSQMRRWQLQPASGAVLTVSVANPQAGQTNVPGTKRPFLRGRSSPAKTARRQPKGVPLRFNFRAVANQTGLTLNDRFSGLRNKRPFRPLRSTGRMVTLP